MVQRYEPMLLRPTDVLPDGENWILEPKLNGYRALAYVTVERTRLRSRQGNNLADQFPEVVEQLPVALIGHAAVVDGEVVGFGQEGEHNLRTIRQRTSKMVYYIFDMLKLDGEPLVKNPWHERHRLLEASVAPQGHIEICPHYSATSRDDLLVAAKDLALEGLVAKEINSRYWQDRRTKYWHKYKFNKHRAAFT